MYGSQEVGLHGSYLYLYAHICFVCMCVCVYIDIDGWKYIYSVFLPFPVQT